ncbi:gamma-glutamyl-gamma-aminobutyrate hydrolase family protein [Fodinibius salsisoli]|uniref:Type 1 glutamine amidotransferase n=1 Tax=Fodinibius salsisoli TaxID=2820877 RepID=A0ABT3PR52_9BACT|nr:type 1 glutamine amidotransferase [Fodinibius salsisoli]MCW9708338.1 type 1 glutamine amidotransferase [Fodinibius salsisoli]
MSEPKPNIGVTGPDRGGTAAWLFTKWAVFLHGGKAIRIQPGNEKPEVELHGLILGGGADISPRFYGGEGAASVGLKGQDRSRGFFRMILNILFLPIIFLVRAIFSTKSPKKSKDRDQMELKLLRKALENKWPVLGICRGAQLINIHFGGTLHNDITDFYTETPYIYSVWPRKKIAITDGSLLSGILSFEQDWINALHHQAIDRCGEGIVIAAKEENGIIQAIEYDRKPFLIGVQWHPEYMPQIPAQRAIFKELVSQANKRRTVS